MSVRPLMGHLLGHFIYGETVWEHDLPVPAYYGGPVVSVTVSPP